MSGTPKAVTIDHLRALAARTEDCIADVASTAADAIEEAARTLGAAMTGATSGAAGTKGQVPAPAAGDNSKFLRGDGTWSTPSMAGATFHVGTTAPSSEMIWFKTES